MKKSYLAFFTLLAFSCQLDESEPETQVSDQLEIVSASDEAKDLFDEWIGNSNPNARTAPQFSTKDMVRINRSGMTRYAAPKLGDPNTSLSFIINKSNNIDMSFISTSVANSDRTVTSKMYSMENGLIATFVHNPDGTLKEKPTVHGFWEYWDKVDECVGKLTQPFESNIANVAFDVSLTFVTRGAWLPAVGISCMGESLIK